MAFFEGFIDTENEMIVNISRIPMGKDKSDEKRFWVSMQNLFMNGYHVQRDQTVKKGLTLHRFARQVLQKKGTIAGLFETPSLNKSNMNIVPN